MIRVRMGARHVLHGIARRKGWKVTEAVDRAAAALAKQEGIDPAQAAVEGQNPEPAEPVTA